MTVPKRILTEKQLQHIRKAQAASVASRKPVPERFLSYVEKNGPNGCWLWTGPLSYQGYGVFFNRIKHVYAHRYSWEILHGHGPVPAPLCLDHLCRVPPCVNPAHLEPVTLRENILRGVSIVARLAKSDECKNGHSLLGENCRRDPKGYRLCRVCEAARQRKYLSNPIAYQKRQETIKRIRLRKKL